MDQFKEEQRMEQIANRSNDINLLNMIESRIMEVIQIEDECKRKLPKLYNQRLPRFMRRRAACHNTKRLPKKLRPSINSAFGSKSRASLLKYRRRTRFQKHKRVLKKHGRCKYKDKNKFLLHKWFAKRFKMNPEQGPMWQVPMFNNTKNQRNLQRQARYGCAYLSLGHLRPIQLCFEYPIDSWQMGEELEKLNKMTTPVSGFTFCATSIRQGRYEVAIHLYKTVTSLETSQPSKAYLCPSFVQIQGSQQQDKKISEDQHKTFVTLWIPKINHKEVVDCLNTISKEGESGVVNFKLIDMHPCNWARVRLVGPDARIFAQRLAKDEDKHKSAVEDADLRLSPQFGLSIGRYIQENNASFVYYNTRPKTVDIILKGPEGRMLWHQLVKNRAHLVGGHRDIDRLLVSDCFKVVPDF